MLKKQLCTVTLFHSAGRKGKKLHMCGLLEVRWKNKTLSSRNPNLKSLAVQFDVTSRKNVTRLFDFGPPKDKLFGPSNHRCH